VPTRDRIALRRKVRAEAGCDAETAGPWDVEEAEGKTA
jgi:hypothetical protein